MQIGRWRIVAWLGVTRSSRIAHARRLGDAADDVLRVLPDDGDRASFLREYQRLEGLAAPGIVRPVEWLDDGAGAAMVLGVPGAVPLPAHLGEMPWPWRDALHFAAALSQALAALHARDLVHRDLRPQNLLLAGPGRLPLIADLSAAAAPGPAIEAPVLAGAGDEAGPWVYGSPEQTGRVGRPVDARSDLYALGVLLYRLLAGRLPFDARDPLEWVHCHLARMPRSPAELVPQIPPQVADIVLKLLAKAPEQRYQSAAGLQADLQYALQQAPGDRAAPPFPLGAHDAANPLGAPSQLFGRERESAALTRALHGVLTSRKPRLVLLTGPAGGGKSALVQRMHEAAAAAGGRCVVAKYDLDRRDVPYSALTQALQELVRHLLAGAEPAVRSWRARLQSALGINAGLAAALVPGLALLLDGTRPAPPADGPEAQRRLHLVLRQLFALMAADAPPLVLCLDDLQWADPGSLALLPELVGDPQIASLLVVGTCRDADDGVPSGVLSAGALVERLGLAQLPVLGIEVGPLSADDLARWLASSLSRALEDVQPLAALVREKTDGNPLFVVELVRELQARGLLQRGAAGWHWDLAGIRVAGYTDSVADLLVRKLRGLAPPAQLLLRGAACLGSEADLELLAELAGLAPERVAAELAEAVRQSLLQPLGSRVRFTHDRVREAAYALLSPDERAATHASAGRLWLQRLPPAALEERLFDVVHQLNEGQAALAGHDEAARLYGLNLRAARKAKDAAAAAAARHYLLRALALQPPDAWHSGHAQAFELALDLAECEFVAGDAEAGDRRLEHALQHACSDAERVQLHLARSRLRLFSGRYLTALDAALTGLALLGVALTSDEAGIQAMRAADHAALTQALGGRSAADLLELPAAPDPARGRTLALLVEGFSPALHSKPSLFPLLVLKAVRLSLQLGHSVESCFAYAYYARILRAEGRLEEACAYSELSLQLAQRLGDPRPRGRLLFVHLVTTYFLRHAYAEGLPLVDEAFDACLRMGNLYHAGFCAIVAQEYLLESGARLDQMLESAEKYAPFLKQMRNDTTLRSLYAFAQSVRALKGLTRAADSLDDGAFDEAELVQALTKAESVSGIGMYRVLKLVLACHAGQHTQALGWAREAAEPLRRLGGTGIEVIHRHYRALSLAALCPVGAAPPGLVAALEAEHAELGRWAEACPANFHHRWLLVGAELARIHGRPGDAEGLYEQAIAAAHRERLVHHEAQALERAAAFELERGHARFALALRHEAQRGYERWGAQAKARAMQEADSGPAPEGRPGLVSLDTLSVVKASQALSSLIDVDELLDALMRIALESAGAQRAQLYLVQGETLRPAATAMVSGDAVEVRLERDADDAELQPLAVLNYVRRSRERVLLGDAGQPNPFSSDPYMRHWRPRSVMCLPLQRRADLIGLLYLEHRLSTHAFTPAGEALLGMLAAQAAISLETARLYTALKQEIADRRRAEHASQERQQRLQRLVESNLIGVRFADLADGRIFDANDAYLRIVGYTRDDLAAGRLSGRALTPPEFHAADARAGEALRRAGRYEPYEKEYLRKDGTRVPVLVSGILFEGERAQSVAFVLDLTARRQAEAERTARIAAEAANEAKSSFLASMSHELRTPLNGILGYAQLLQMDDDLSARQRKAVATIETSGNHLLALINDVLDIARIEAGHVELAAEPVRPLAVLEKAADIIRPRALQKGLAFDVEVLDDLPATIECDERRLSQVLLNLLGNAVKFTDRGRVALRARSRAEGPGRARLVFEVEDSGVGMNSDELQRIFRPFQQVGAARRRAEGSGLGLAVSEALMREMGGRLDVDSEAGRGSRFSMSFVATVLDPPRPSEVPAPAITGYAGPRLRALIVDDTAASRAVLTELLASLDFGTAEAEDGEQALAHALAARPDLVLIDNTMPGISGNEVTRRLRRDPRFDPVPIIAVSAGASDAERKNCLDAGASAFLRKPVDIAQLLKTIGELLQLDWTRAD